MVTTDPAGISPLHDDLAEMLTATRSAEHDLFDAVPAAEREAPRRIGEWSVKDVRAHLAAWRSVEALRLAGEPDGTNPDESDDDANARIQSQRAAWTWERVAEEADGSIDRLIAAIGTTSAEELARSDGLVAGIGANGANHAVGHLADLVPVVDGSERYDAFLQQIKAILLRGRIPERDAGVVLYNIACHHALAGELDEARALLRDAFARRPDLAEFAAGDVDLVALRDELGDLSGR